LNINPDISQDLKKTVIIKQQISMQKSCRFKH